MRKTFIKWLPAILWMVFIFWLSSLQTTGIKGTYAQRFFILKSFHIIEYGVLALLLWLGSGNQKKALLLTYLYAISDELHQLFVQGRTGKFVDTIIDMFGAIIFMSITTAITKLRVFKLLKAKYWKKTRS